MAEWIDVADAQVLEPAGRALVRAGGLELAVFRRGSETFALEDSCPHSGASLCSGRLDDGHVQCPAHGLRFRLSDGRLAGSPVGGGSPALAVPVFPARVVGGRLQVRLRDEADREARPPCDTRPGGTHP